MVETTDEEILRRLDTIIALLQVAHKDALDKARRDIEADPIASAILRITDASWVDSGTLRSKVIEEVGTSERTVRRRISALVAQRILEQAGHGSSTRYRTTHLL